jgi:hypothetical protein
MEEKKVKKQTYTCLACGVKILAGALCITCKANKVKPKRESGSTMELARYLSSQGFLFCHIPNGMHSSPKTTNIVKHMGLSIGAPDFLVFDLLLAIEMKSKKGIQSDAQKQWEKRLNSFGWHYILPRSTQEAIDLITTIKEKKHGTT